MKSRRRNSLSKILGVRSFYHGCIVLFSIAWLGGAVLIVWRGRSRLNAKTVSTTDRGAAPTLLALFTLMLSGVSMILYAYDKMAARIESGGVFRISEATLHAVSRAGGWPGSALAQQMFRHKCTKAAFQRTFLFSIIENVLLVGLLAKLFGFSFIPYLLWTSDGRDESLGRSFGFYENAPMQKSEEL
eukprot:scaffold3058_cov177-Amphora_coffeaeformis.AAC.5